MGIVFIFHLWPQWLSGGYVGVDVFFVISGFLITGKLSRDSERDGKISLLEFYSGRVRRLLPAATLVLFVTFFGMFAFLPSARWEETAAQILASAFYVQNWALAARSIDYLSADADPSPVQHYWSLSIEGQFYVVWPLLIIAAIWIARRFDVPSRALTFFVVSIIFASSFAASVILTEQDPGYAYFVTHTRIWELALGGLLALTIHHGQGMPGSVRASVAVAGLAAILWSAITYTPSTIFPGIAALVPTLGTAAVILAGDIKLGAFRRLKPGWLIWLGDRSYSLYLWHWPIIIFYTAWYEKIGLMDGIGLMAITVVLSHISYGHIEQRYRHSRYKSERRPLVYGLGSLAGAVVAFGVLQHWMVSQGSAGVSPADARYPGPAVLVSNVSAPPDIEPIPPLAVLKRDLPSVYDKCHQNQRRAEPVHCILGNPEGRKTIAVVGDSHAANWIPALERIATQNDWRLLTFTKSACAFSRVEVQLKGKPYTSCMEWRENVVEFIRSNPVDIMFIGQSPYRYIDKEVMVRGLRSVWGELSQLGIRIIPIQDTPFMPFQPEECLARKDGKSCVARRKEVLPPDVFEYASSTMDGIHVVDMNDAICGPEICETIVGNMIVWRDRHHLSATYSAALAPYLAKQVGLPFPKVPRSKSVRRSETPSG
ncbi:acyltransferase [Tianweitania sp. Rool2]|uniref:Acyltransferase n=1 Tax=Oryzicola mucosus TaxID=2767425 RepID=A0A8J6PJU1_9HYPH|nr:acyltransferase [Oryzicola mucosus]